MNRHHRRAAKHRGRAPKTKNMSAFERELAANVRLLRPGLQVQAVLRDENPAFAVVRVLRVFDGDNFVDVRLPAPVGYSSSTYTHLLLEHYDALLEAAGTAE